MKTRAALARSPSGVAAPRDVPGERDVRGARTDAGPELFESLQQLVVASARLATGYAICARSARELRVADVGGSLSTLYRAVADELAAFLATSGSDVPRTKSTCSERLRWEWLASTAHLMDGAPDRQILAECARIEDGVAAHVVSLRDRGSKLDDDRLRQVVTLLERGRAASERLGTRAQRAAIAPTFI